MDDYKSYGHATPLLSRDFVRILSEGATLVLVLTLIFITFLLLTALGGSK